MKNKRQEVEQKDHQHDQETGKKYHGPNKKQREDQQMKAGFLRLTSKELQPELQVSQKRSHPPFN